MSENLSLLLRDILGQTKNPNLQWVYYDCPFCNHHKPKFAINVITCHWKCWVCGARGINLFSLIRKLGKWHLHNRVEAIKPQIIVQPIKKQKKLISLPKQFIPLSLNKDFIMKKRVLSYLKKRDINMYQIQKYNLGFCQVGKYQNRIIIPSYNKDNQLNYFTARSIEKHNSNKYINPSLQKNNAIVFESLINWKFPVILVQGIFDAMTVNFNSIPLMGKNVSQILAQKLSYYDSDIYLCLDKDAKQQQYETMKKLHNIGLNNLYYMNITAKDANEMGRIQFWKQLLNNSKQYTVSQQLDILKEKINMVNK